MLNHEFKVGSGCKCALVPVSAAKAPVYFYHFTHKPSFSSSPDWVLHSTHVEEMPFMWGDTFMPEGPLAGIVKYTAEEVALSSRMMTFWANFARNGYVLL